MRESRTSGSTSGVRRRSMDELVRHRQPKGSATDMLILNHRAASRLYRMRALERRAFQSEDVDLEFNVQSSNVQRFGGN